MHASRVQMGLLHPDYQMEIFRLVSNSFELNFETFYDHSLTSVNLTKTSLYDLTGNPYTVSPKEFYNFIKKHGKQKKKSPQGEVLKKPREMIFFNGMQMCLTSYYSITCPLKQEGFNSAMKMRI